MALELTREEAEKLSTIGARTHTLSDAQRSVFQGLAQPNQQVLVEEIGGQAAALYELIQEGKSAFATR